MHFSKITQKGQATIPVAIRDLLGIHTGDAVGFDIEDGKVIITKASPLDITYAKALESTLSEWSSPGDDAYNDL